MSGCSGCTCDPAICKGRKARYIYEVETKGYAFLGLGKPVTLSDKDGHVYEGVITGLQVGPGAL